MSDPRPCRFCGEPCQEPVDDRFPAEAKAAYEAAGYSTALTCGRGQFDDLRATGWCWDRLRRLPGWTGAPLKPSERRGLGAVQEALDARRVKI